MSLISYISYLLAHSVGVGRKIEAIINALPYVYIKQEGRKGKSSLFLNSTRFLIHFEEEKES